MCFPTLIRAFCVPAISTRVRAVSVSALISPDCRPGADAAAEAPVFNPEASGHVGHHGTKVNGAAIRAIRKE